MQVDFCHAVRLNVVLHCTGHRLGEASLHAAVPAITSFPALLIRCLVAAVGGWLSLPPQLVGEGGLQVEDVPMPPHRVVTQLCLGAGHPSLDFDQVLPSTISFDMDLVRIPGRRQLTGAAAVLVW